MQFRFLLPPNVGNELKVVIAFRQFLFLLNRFGGKFPINDWINSIDIVATSSVLSARLLITRRKSSRRNFNWTLREIDWSVHRWCQLTTSTAQNSQIAIATYYATHQHNHFLLIAQFHRMQLTGNAIIRTRLTLQMNWNEMIRISRETISFLFVSHCLVRRTQSM